MYRVLLVEDEEIIRKGIRYSVPWEECGCSVVGEAGEVGQQVKKRSLNCSLTSSLPTLPCR